MKRIIIPILAIVMALTIIPVVAEEDDGDYYNIGLMIPGKHYEFSFFESELTMEDIVKYTGWNPAKKLKDGSTFNRLEIAQYVPDVGIEHIPCEFPIKLKEYTLTPIPGSWIPQIGLTAIYDAPEPEPEPEPETKQGPSNGKIILITLAIGFAIAIPFYIAMCRF